MPSEKRSIFRPEAMRRYAQPHSPMELPRYLASWRVRLLWALISLLTGFAAFFFWLALRAG